MIAALEAENAQMRADVERMMAAVRAHEALVQALRIRIARLRRQKFGASSERIEREIEQLELALDALGVVASPAGEPIPDKDGIEAVKEPRPATEALPRRRKPKVSATTPRERIVLDPGETCPDCGGALRLIGEDVGEITERIAASLKVIETARPKKSCRRCGGITQAPAPSRPIPRSMAGPARPCSGLEARRPSSPVSSERDRRPHGRGHPGLDAGRLVRPGHAGARAPGGANPRRGHDRGPAALR